MATTNMTAKLINDLFKEHLKPNGQEYSYQEVSKGIQTLGGELDASYIGKIRKGVIKNPGRDALMLLCRFFQVPASYFFPELSDLPTVEASPEERPLILFRMALRDMNVPDDLQKNLEGIVITFQQQNKAKEPDR
jgi:transcriptional regulator with XRE-family HTH domain